MQKTQWRSRTSSCKFRWLDNEKSQGSQWQLRVSKQSSIRSRGAGSRHSKDPGVSVQKQNFTRNPEKLAKVPGTREETISHLHWQFLRTRKSLWTTSSTVQSTRRTSTSTFQDYHILQWNNHMAPTYKVWFRISRTTLIDKHFKAIFNNVKNSIPSAKNHKTWFVKLGTSNYANYCACRTGTSALSTARVGTSCEMERRRTSNSSSTLSISSRFPITTSRKFDPTGTVTGRSQGITNTSPRIRSRRNARRDISWVFTTGSSVMRSSARIWLTWVTVKNMSWDGQIGERRSHAPHHSKWNSSLSKQLVDPFEHSEFRHDARKASNWFQRSLNNLATAQEPGGSSLLPKVAKFFFFFTTPLLKNRIAESHQTSVKHRAEGPPPHGARPA